MKAFSHPFIKSRFPLNNWLPLSLFLALTTCVQAQTVLQGRIVDAESGTPLAFVNIGLLGKSRGTVSDEYGRFRLPAAPGDSVAFSAIGYQRAGFLAEELVDGSEVRLDPVVYRMEEVEVYADVPGKLQIFGHQIKKRKQSVQYGSAQLGTEMGAHIRIREKSWIKSAHFILNHAKGDSMFFRVNIYEFREGRIGKNLLRENVLVRQPQATGTLSVDLRPYQVVLEQDVLLSLEWIRDDNGRGNEGISFRCRIAGTENAYTKATSQAPFRKVSELAPAAPGLQLGFYLSGKQIE